jgi:hypothetical protein
MADFTIELRQNKQSCPINTRSWEETVINSLTTYALLAFAIE